MLIGPPPVQKNIELAMTQMVDEYTIIQMIHEIYTSRWLSMCIFERLISEYPYIGNGRLRS